MSTTTYLTAERIASLKQYVTDVASGVDTVIAWNAHKARMDGQQQLRSILAKAGSS